MSDLLAARLSMASSLGFHIIFACIGMVMPFLMAIAHRTWLIQGDVQAYRLTKLWMRGTAIFFATGAVSGTALSFELGLLWPEFMLHAGAIIGMPFSLEGAAFFIEAIALGIFMYGWGRLSPRAHWVCGLIVGVAGLSSGMLVIAANGWMNSPAGFEWVDGQAQQIDPIAAMLNPAWATQSIHMAVAAVQSVGFAVAGIHAFLYLRGKDIELNRLALQLSLPVAVIASLAQPMVGHWAAQDVAHRQPLKLAAMEAHFETHQFAPLWIGGIPDEETQSVCCGVQIPGGLSFLAFNDPSAEVIGLDQYPRDEWPPVLIVHLAFQCMVFLGSWMALLSLITIFLRWKKPHWLYERRFLWALVLTTPMGFIAVEAGWVVTEVGRQPWIIYNIMKTRDALAPIPGQMWHFVTFIILYLGIGIGTTFMWRHQVTHVHTIGAPSEHLSKWRGGSQS